MVTAPIIDVSEHRKLIVCLVHGTIPTLFGRRFSSKTPWIEDDSWFRGSLFPSAEGVIYSPFRWSGYNSHRARVQAGVDLAAHLVRLKEEYPDDEHVCVAHSHGGNVAVYALRNVFNNDPSKMPHRLVTLGTPFFHAAQRNSAEICQMIKGIAIQGCVVWTMLLFLCCIWDDLHHQLALIACCSSALLLSVFVFCSVVMFFSKRDLQCLAAKQYSMISTEPPPHIKVMCISADRDEAELYLRSLERINLMLFGKWQITACTMAIRCYEILGSSLLAMALLRSPQVLGALETVAPALAPVVEPIKKTVSAVMAPVILLLMIASALGIVFLFFVVLGTALIRSGPWGFGENLMLHWLLKIDIKEEPMRFEPEQLTAESDTFLKLDLSRIVSKGSSDVSITNVRWTYSRFTFQHSGMYSDRRVCESIQRWVAG